jgi:hypothetical protein
LGCFEESIPSLKCHEGEFLTRKFYTFKMKEEKYVKKIIIEICNLVNQLTVVGTIISNGDLACALLGSMPN